MIFWLVLEKNKYVFLVLLINFSSLSGTKRDIMKLIERIYSIFVRKEKRYVEFRKKLEYRKVRYTIIRIKFQKELIQVGQIFGKRMKEDFL
jgi:hypothetical protein